jgi:hypothetical protein
MNDDRISSELKNVDEAWRALVDAIRGTEVADNMQAIAALTKIYNAAHVIGNEAEKLEQRIEDLCDHFGELTE